jgi:O-Antigen ligase
MSFLTPSSLTQSTDFKALPSQPPSTPPARPVPPGTVSAPDGTTARPTFHSRPATLVERLMLTFSIAILPLENHIPAMGRFSVMFLLFALMGCHVVLNRTKTVARTWLHPVFLTGYGLVLIGVMVESLHIHASYQFLSAVAQMFLGGVVVASLCHDRQALRAALHGYILAGVWLGLFLLVTSYGPLRNAVVSTFQEAGELRKITYENLALRVDLNTMSFYAAQGAAVALALTLNAATRRPRIVYGSFALICLLASFLPFSRGGIAIALASCATVMIVYTATRPSRLTHTLAVAVVMAVGLAYLVPSAILERLQYSTETSTGGRMEGRAFVYSAAVRELPEYGLLGVGAGNFMSDWGEDSAFAYVKGATRYDLGETHLAATHNCFVQVTLCWGLPGFIALMVVIWQAYRCLPKAHRDDALALCLYGIAVSLLLRSMVVHNLYAKEFSFGLGLLVGTRLWIWPRRRSQRLLWTKPLEDEASPEKPSPERPLPEKPSPEGSVERPATR